MNTNLYNQLCQEGIHPEWAANAASVHQMIQEKKEVPIFMLQKYNLLSSWIKNSKGNMKESSFFN